MEYYLLEFVIITIAGYFTYYYLFMKKNDKKNKKPIEFSYLENRYGLKLEKINKKRLSKFIAFCNALIIATTVIVIDFFELLALQLLIGFVILMALITVTYYFIGLYYQKKGLTKNV